MPVANRGTNGARSVTDAIGRGYRLVVQTGTKGVVAKVPYGVEITNKMELEASPERVWEMIATGPGLDCWFMGRNEVEPRQGGAIRLQLGEYAEHGAVTAWDPPEHFAYRGATGEDDLFLAFDYIIKRSAHGGSTLRLVTSGTRGDDWEAEREALKATNDLYLHTLAQYLAYFPGRPGTPVNAAVPPQEAGGQDVMTVLLRGLGLTGAVSEGDHVRLTPNGLPPIEGVVDYRTADHLGVRSEDGLYRFIHGYQHMGFVGHHLYRAGIDQKQTERDWQNWLAGLLA